MTSTSVPMVVSSRRQAGARSCGSGTSGMDMRSHNSAVMRKVSATSTSVPMAAAWHQPPVTGRFEFGNCRLAERSWFSVGKQQDRIPFYSVAYSPDGRLVAAGRHDGSIHLWDAASGLESGVLLGHTHWVVRLCFSPEGRRLVSASADGSVRVWCLSTMQELIDLALGRSIAIADAAEAIFSRDGNRLVSRDHRYWYVWEFTPLDREALIRREAHGFVRFHLKRAASKGDFLDRIAYDQTISETVRSVSMSLVEGLWESESEVRAQARKQALRLKTQEQCGRLLADCWKVVKLPGRDAGSYLMALRNAEEALRLWPDDHRMLNAVGVAQYRAGRYQRRLA